MELHHNSQDNHTRWPVRYESELQGHVLSATNIKLAVQGTFRNVSDARLADSNVNIYHRDEKCVGRFHLAQSLSSLSPRLQ